MKVKSESEVTQLCPTLSDPMDCSLPGSSIHGIFQARVLEWVAIAFSGHGFNDDLYNKYPSICIFGSEICLSLRTVEYNNVHLTIQIPELPSS